MSTKEDLETWTNGTFGEYEIHLTAGFYKVYFHGAWGGGSKVAVPMMNIEQLHTSLEYKRSAVYIFFDSTENEVFINFCKFVSNTN